MIEAGWNVASGTCNGPQVVALSCAVPKLRTKHLEGMHEVPLDVCGADSQGAIGYSLTQTLQNELRKRGIHKPVATVIQPDARGRERFGFPEPQQTDWRFHG